MATKYRIRESIDIFGSHYIIQRKWPFVPIWIPATVDAGTINKAYEYSTYEAALEDLKKVVKDDEDTTEKLKATKQRIWKTVKVLTSFKSRCCDCINGDSVSNKCRILGEKQLNSFRCGYFNDKKQISELNKPNIKHMVEELGLAGILKEKLDQGAVSFSFELKSGAWHKALGTRNISIIKMVDGSIPVDPEKETEGTISYWDLEACGWRSCRSISIIDIHSAMNPDEFKKKLKKQKYEINE